MKIISSILTLFIAVLLVSCNGNSSKVTAESEESAAMTVSQPAKEVDAAIRSGIGIGDVAPDFELEEPTARCTVLQR